MTPPEDGFGPLVSPHDVEVAVVEALKLWTPTYLSKAERTHGYSPGQVELPRGIVTTSEFDNWPGDSFPVYLVISAGTIGLPVRRGDGSYEATWGVGIAPVVTDINEGATRKLASVHASAIRLALTQHKSLRSEAFPSGFAKWLKWSGESFADLPFLQSRSMGSMRCLFDIGTDHVMTEYAGPREPLPKPSEEIPPVPGQVVEVEVGAHADPLVGAPS